MKRNHYLLPVLVACLLILPLHEVDAQQYSKLSSSLRGLLLEAPGTKENSRAVLRQSPSDKRHVCALVRTADLSSAPLSENGCRTLARIGNVFVADVPLNSLSLMAADPRICRVEAERGNQLQLDSMALYTNATDIYTARHLSQAYTGSGVVVGLMDVGFDLTHPTFLDTEGKGSRIMRFWDQLSTDTIGSDMYVGAEYTSAEAISRYAHSRDAVSIFHGTHTLGIAAGNGAGTPYAGMAPDSELCLVSNAVSGDEPYISDVDLYRYTTATDLLGFKYLFDYAASVGKPCVVSFSEGSRQDFRGDDQLYYEALSHLVGPGRIIVASAGNESLNRSYVGKPVGMVSAGTFVSTDDNYVGVTINTRGNLNILTKLCGLDGDHRIELKSKHIGTSDHQVVMDVPVSDVCASPDSLLSEAFAIDDVDYRLTMSAYHSCYEPDDIVVDVHLERTDEQKLGQEGYKPAFLVTGEDGMGEIFSVHGSFLRVDDYELDDAVNTHNILSPGSAPSVICVGSTSYRPSYVNMYGTEKNTHWGPTRQRSSFSSVGPTFDGRVKPDVMAPGANVISAMSSYYMESHTSGISKLVSEQAWNGRTYGWSVECGTSMSAPAVAGIIALWLEANPRLSPADVMDVIRRTSHPCGDYGDMTPFYCGCGAIDAYAGLLDVLGLLGIDALSAVNPAKVDIKIVDSKTLCVAFDAPIDADGDLRVYGVDGKLRMRQRLVAGTECYSLDVSGMEHGVYAVQVTTRHESGSVLVRK